MMTAVYLWIRKGIADLLALVDTGHTKRQAACIFAGFRLDLIHIEGRIRHHIITLTSEIVRIMIEGVGFVTRLDAAPGIPIAHEEEKQDRIEAR